MKIFFEKWLGAILVVITIAFFTFHGGRASEADVNKVEVRLTALITETATNNKETSKLAQKNAQALSKIIGYIEAKAEKK